MGRTVGVNKKMGVDWHLRRIMAERGMFATSDLVPLLAECGVHLSREQVYRLVTQSPQRLSMDTLAALCDILQCAVGDLIEVVSSTSRCARLPGTAARRRPARRCSGRQARSVMTASHAAGRALPVVLNPGLPPPSPSRCPAWIRGSARLLVTPGPASRCVVRSQAPRRPAPEPPARMRWPPGLPTRRRQ